MVNSGVISKGALATGVLGVGLVSGLAAASLGMTGVAVASCVNISGIAIGGGGACAASFGSFAIVIGPTGEEGSTATAGNEGFSLGLAPSTSPSRWVVAALPARARV